MTPALPATSFSYSARIAAHKLLQPFRLALYSIINNPRKTVNILL